MINQSLSIGYGTPSLVRSKTDLCDFNDTPSRCNFRRYREPISASYFFPTFLHFVWR